MICVQPCHTYLHPLAATAREIAELRAQRVTHHRMKKSVNMQMVINSMHICLVYRFYILLCFMQEIRQISYRSKSDRLTFTTVAVPSLVVQLIATSTSMNGSIDCTSFRGHNTVYCFLCSPMLKLSLQVHTVYSTQCYTCLQNYSLYIPNKLC